MVLRLRQTRAQVFAVSCRTFRVRSRKRIKLASDRPVNSLGQHSKLDCTGGFKPTCVMVRLHADTGPRHSRLFLDSF